MAKESVLTDAEKESFVIKKFIFHIIEKENVNPTYLDEVTLTKEQENFFKKQFATISEGVQYIFKDERNSNFVKNCELLLGNIDEEFHSVSKALTASFKGYHKKSSNDGVFITSVVEVSGERNLIFLLKLDHRKVYQYTVHGAKALLSEIQKTFVEDKSSIQKSALIDVSNYYLWDVLATDKKVSGDNQIRNYFSEFLSVVERETASALTRKAIRTVSKWAKVNRDILPEDAAFYNDRAIKYISISSKFSTKKFIEAVTQESTKGMKLYDSLKVTLDEVGLTGQNFKPAPNSLDKKQQKNIRETAEGVKIEWTGNPTDNNITISPQRDKNDGLFHILIRTSEVYNIQ